MVEGGRRAPNSDGDVSRLYAFARELGASILVPAHSRYVVDLNRPADDTSLSPGQTTTGLCPAVQFSGEPVYLEGPAPDAAAVAARIDPYWPPYHQAPPTDLPRILAWPGSPALGNAS